MSYRPGCPQSRVRPFTRLLRERFRALGVPARLEFADGATLELGPDPRITLIFRRRGLVSKLLFGDIDALADAYVRGDLVVEGAISDVIQVGMALAERIGRTGLLSRALALVPKRRHSKTADAEWIRHHYDVSNDFYALWLDQRMIYSCAYFETGAEDIDRAQEQKLEHICRKLCLKPGERLLDVGCGWGGLLEFAARRHGVEGVGITISRSQYDYARLRIAEAGLAGRVEIRLQDYRDLSGEAAFDKIVSVGMYEHVGHRNLPLYFATLARLVRPHGLVLNHDITTTDPEGRPRSPAGGSFIDRFVFPGGELPHIARVVQEIGGQGLDVLDVESLRPHYAMTLDRWVERLEAHEAPALEAAGAERYRIWRTYMAGCAFAFRRNWLSVYQVLAGKPAADGSLSRPWTRRHQYQPSTAVPDSASSSVAQRGRRQQRA